METSRIKGVKTSFKTLFDKSALRMRDSIYVIFCAGDVITDTFQAESDSADTSFVPPLATPTIAGRKTRSPIM